MGLLDNELKSIKSEYTRKPEWALCKYCRVPFLTSKFEISCQRCTHFVQYNIELTAKLMIVYIIFVSMFIIITLGCLIYFSKLHYNFYLQLLLISFSTIIQGAILWKIVKTLLNK